MKEYIVKIDVLSDFMPGSGESVPGLVDNDSKYDENGLPFMNAKTFKGHVREQMENIAYWRGLDISPDTLLGASDINSDKKPGKLKFSDVRLSPGVRMEIGKLVKDEKISAEEVTDAITTIFAFTKIDENGVAKDHTLRRARLVNGGLTFYTSIFAEDLTEDEFSLLKDSVRAVQHIGTYKSKGKGLVRCEITGERSTEKECTQNDPQNGENAKYVTFNIFLEDPVKMGSQGNQSNTTALNYIAGSSIRGAVIDKYIKKKLNGDGSVIDKDSAIAEKLLKDTRFFDAYICSDEKALIPMPAVFFADKHAMRAHKRKEELGEESVLDVSNRANDKPQEGELKVGVNKYCYPKDEIEMEISGVRKCANLHINIGSDDMFRYEAIERGQTFFGVIKCADNNTAGELASLLDGEIIYLGGSKGSGYGRCRVLNSAVAGYHKLLERYGVHRDKENQSGEKKELVIYALSNLILTNKNGKPTAFIEADYLEKKLGISNITLKRHFVSSVETSGYNHKWKAGNIQRTAVKAGSYYRYEYEGSIDESSLMDIEEAGLGQRKQEGFGRILINPYFSQGKIIKLQKSKASDTNSVESMDDSDREMLSKLVNKINIERFSREIREAAMKLSDRYMKLREDEKLSKTQIGRLYNRLTDEKTSKETVTDYIEALTDKTKDEYEKSHIFIIPEDESVKMDFISALNQLVMSDEKWLNTGDSENVITLDEYNKSSDVFEENKKLFIETLYMIMRKGGERNG